MARRTHQPLPAAGAVAGVCLALCACGATPAPSAAGSASASAAASAGSGGRASSGRLTGHFCRDATTFMRNIPAAPAGKHLSAARARANLRVVLHSTVKGFTELEAEAPATLHKPLKTIVRIYQSDEKVLRTTSSMATISQSMVRGDASGSAAFRKVITYISVHCQ